MAINALAQMEGILRTNHAVLMSAYEEQLLIAMIEQFKKLRRSGPTMEKQELCTAYSYLISVLNLVNFSLPSMNKNLFTVKT